MPRAVALFSGGLDSMLSVRILQQQRFEVDALNIRTLYSCCQAAAAQAAGILGTRLTVLSVGDDYLEVVRNPLYGYGKGVNPCVDCRIYMCQMARRFMEEVDACVVVTGEVAGQRPMSQKKLYDFSGRGRRPLIEPLNHGRHFRFDEQTKIVVGRCAKENATLRLLAAREDAPGAVLLVPGDFRGPNALVVGRRLISIQVAEAARSAVTL